MIRKIWSRNNAGEEQDHAYICCNIIGSARYIHNPMRVNATLSPQRVDLFSISAISHDPISSSKAQITWPYVQHYQMSNPHSWEVLGRAISTENEAFSIDKHGNVDCDIGIIGEWNHLTLLEVAIFGSKLNTMIILFASMSLTSKL